MTTMTFNDILNSVDQLTSDEKKTLMEKLSKDEILWREQMLELQEKLGKEAKKMGLDKLTMKEINEMVHRHRAEKRAKSHS